MTISRCEAQADCFVRSSYARSILVFLFLPLGLFLIHLQWVIFGGWPLFNFYHFLSPNDVPLWKGVVGGAALGIAAVRYGPHAFKTLLTGTCVCSAQAGFVCTYGKKLPLADIEKVRSVRGVLKKGLVFILSDGSRHYVCTIFNPHPNPENIAVRLRKRLTEARLDETSAKLNLKG